MTQEALKLALEALEANYLLVNGTETHGGLEQCLDGYYSGCFNTDPINKQTEEAITAIKEALAQTQEPDVQETLHWHAFNYRQAHTDQAHEMWQKLEQFVDSKIKASQRTEQEPWCMKVNDCKTKCEDCPDEPPQRTWVGLTDKEITALFGPFPKYPSEWDDPDFYRLTQAIEAKLKQKNGYSEENT